MTGPLSATTAERVRLEIAGAVQGVGFRPFVWRRATALGLSGWVTNTPRGVTVEAEGAANGIAALLRALREDTPPNARVATLATTPLPPRGGAAFEIRDSDLSGARSATVLPDLATCPECLAEILDPANRRHRYPFTNCTHCGPRYAIVEDLPYDRARTTMRGFPMCAACRAEYQNPADRRFHAEANACPECGPQLAAWDAAGAVLAAREAALGAAADALRAGRIVAVKGLGGFHLMADARNAAAVQLLRERKRRPDKPFAVMFPTLEAIEAEAFVEGEERALLTGRERPIVLLRRRGPGLAGVAPDGAHVGAMLPYTPLHHLLLADLGFPVVATSGNVSDEPIVTDEARALEGLAGIADLFLVHDRPIARPLDDSVARIVEGRLMLLRRARGFAPAPAAQAIFTGILALGAHQKATVALSTLAGIVLSQHLGDLDTPEAHDAYDRAIADTLRLNATPPRLVVRDLHPDYHSSRAAGLLGARTVTVQHHVAHVAAVVAEHRLDLPVLGVAWDGTGLGTDGTIWGGEFIRLTGQGWERVAHLRPFRLPGGEAVAREPRRSALGLLFAAFGREALTMTDLSPVASFTSAERTTLAAMLERDVNAPVTTSAGRLFDAVASLTALCQRATYEGQAAMALEAVADGDGSVGPYDFPVTGAAPMIVDWQPALAAILADIRAGRPVSEISAAFHAGLAAAIAAVAARVGDATVVLSGGCFQNARLTESAADALRAGGMHPFWPQQVPPNDGGLALGQAWWAMKMEAA